MKLLLCLLLVALPAWGGSVYKCTQPDGSVALSDRACPADAVDSEYQGEIAKPFREREEEYNPYSLLEQARRIDEKNHVEQRGRSERERARAPFQEAQPAAPYRDTRPLLTYEEALRRATKDAGYQKYKQLTGFQKGRVHGEMAKYNHLPKPPKALPGDQPELLVDGVPATPVGGGNYIDNSTGHFLQGAAGGVIDTETGQFLPVH